MDDISDSFLVPEQGWRGELGDFGLGLGYWLSVGHNAIGLLEIV